MNLTKLNTFTITDMRENALKLLRKAEKKFGPLYIFYRSKPRAVLLNLEEYEKLRDLAEEYLDSLRAQEYEGRDKRKEKWFSLEEVAQDLGINGMAMGIGLGGSLFFNRYPEEIASREVSGGPRRS